MREPKALRRSLIGWSGGLGAENTVGKTFGAPERAGLDGGGGVSAGSATAAWGLHLSAGVAFGALEVVLDCLLYTSPSPRD